MQKQVRCAKNSIWDLINSNINKRDERDVQMGLYWECKHSSNTDDENMIIFFFFFFFFFRNRVCVKEPDGLGEEASSSVFQFLPSCS